MVTIETDLTTEENGTPEENLNYHFKKIWLKRAPQSAFFNRMA